MAAAATETMPPPLKYKVHPIHATVAEPVLLRTLAADDIFILGGQFAILCQWAHPRLARGSTSSSFASRVMQRLWNTERFTYTAVHGTQEQKEVLFSVIHRYHARVKSPEFDADDPELHKWTAATIFVAVLLVREAIYGKLEPEQQEQLCQECAVFATSLRMPPEMWPANLDEFWEYWNYNIASLEFTDEARQLCSQLMNPTNIPVHLQAMIPLGKSMTSVWLPPRLAREYDMMPTALDRAVTASFLYSVSWWYPYLPQMVRRAYRSRIPQDVDKAIARIRKTGHWAGA